MIKNETNVFAYPEKNEEFDREDLSQTLSPLSQFFIQLFEDTISSYKPNILLYPYHFVSPLPLLAYRTAKLTNKDVIIISNADNIKQHLKNYELLSQPDGQYVFKFCIPIEIIDGQAEVKIYSKRVPNKLKRSNSEYLLGISELPEIRKIVFCDYFFLSEAMSQEQNSFFPELNKTIKCKIDVGAIFFENVDSIIKNSQSCNDFCNWIKEYSQEEHNVLIHFNDPYNRTSEILANNVGGTILDYNHYYLREAIKLSRASKSRKYDVIPSSINPPDLKVITVIDVPNLNLLIEELNKIRHSLYETKIDVPINFRTLFNLKELLLKLSVHPSLFKFTVVDKEGNFIHATIDHYLSILKENIDEIHPDVRGLIKQYISTLNTLYFQLKETTRHGEAQTYSTECKNSFLLNYLLSRDKTGEKTNINILTYSRTEVKLLNDDIEKLKLKNLNVEVYYLRNAIRDCDLSTIAIVCGTPNKRSEFVRIANSFKEVLVISYSGKEHETTLNTLEKVNDKEYLKKAVKHNHDNIELIKQRDETFTFTEKLEQESEKEQIDEPILDSESHQEMDIDPIEFEKRINEYNVSRSIGSSTENLNIVIVENISTKQIFPIGCGSATQFIIVDPDGSYYSEPFEDLNEGDTILRFGPSEKDDILKLIAEMYGLEDDVDTDIIRLWKNSFFEGITNLRKKLGKNEQKIASVNRVYDEYKKTCKEVNANPKTYVTFVGWVQDKRIGPEDIEDVKVLGLIGSFPNINNEYAYIHDQMKLIRKGHVQVGHKISKIIKNIMAKKETKSLNYQEKILHDRIQLFKVLKIVKKENKN